MLAGGGRLQSEMTLGKSAVLFCGQVPGGPIFGREADAPETGIGDSELDRRIEFLRFGGRHQLDCTFSFFACPYVRQRNGLAMLEGGVQFHKRAVRIHNDRVSLFAERRFIGQLAFNDHANLEK